ncbi:MAG: hypothetical protein JWN08_1799 [Frankiales bacterium]|nr:hypothetical protein [Frankiales bacterium]
MCLLVNDVVELHRAGSTRLVRHLLPLVGDRGEGSGTALFELVVRDGRVVEVHVYLP